MMNNPSSVVAVAVFLVIVMFGTISQRDGVSHEAATQSVTMLLPAPRSTREVTFDNGRTLIEYDLGRVRCYETKVEARVHFSCTGH